MEGEDVVTDTEVVETTNASYYCAALSLEPLPQRIYHFHHQFLSPLPKLFDNFFKGVKWSPDGSCFLTCSEDKSLRCFDMPTDAFEAIADDTMWFREDSFTSVLGISEGETVYDFSWYPRMTMQDPSTCVFATTTRDHPVHLWDSLDGKLRCTYRAYDDMDEISSAFSVAFNQTGNRLFCGYNKKIRVFETERPGRESSQYSTLLGSKEGQTGIISCLAFNSHHSDLLAAGSYDRTTGLYNEQNGELLYVLHGQLGGITQVHFSKDGNYLYTGARKDPNIICWDIRHTSSLVYKLPRTTADTNQRIAFDIEPFGRHLATGGQDGSIRFFDLRTGELVVSMFAASDTVNGFCFHPSFPFAASTSGHRRYPMAEFLEDEDSTVDLTVQENCASIWRFSYSWESLYYDSTVPQIECA